MQSTFPINTPLTLGDLLDLTFRLYRAHLGKMVLTIAILSVPMGLLNILLFGQSSAAMFLILRDLLEGSQPTVTPITQTPGWLPVVFTPLALLIGGLQALAITSLGIEALHGNPLSLAAGYKQAGNALLRWIGAVLLMIAIAIGIAIVVSIVWFIIFFIFAAVIGGMAALLSGFDPTVGEGNIAIVVGLAILGVTIYIAILIAVAAPFVYFFARWSLVIPCLVEEDLGPSRALGRSWELTKGNIWRAVGYTILTGIIGFTFVSLPVAALQGLLLWLIPAEQFWLTASLTTALSTIVGIALTPVTVLANMLFYYELRVRKESYDLALMIEKGEG